jgi:hypothetical protein
MMIFLAILVIFCCFVSNTNASAADEELQHQILNWPFGTTIDGEYSIADLISPERKGSVEFVEAIGNDPEEAQLQFEGEPSTINNSVLSRPRFTCISTGDR